MKYNTLVQKIQNILRDLVDSFILYVTLWHTEICVHWGFIRKDISMSRFGGSDPFGFRVHRRHLFVGSSRRCKGLSSRRVEITKVDLDGRTAWKQNLEISIHEFNVEKRTSSKSNSWKKQSSDENWSKQPSSRTLQSHNKSIRNQSLQHRFLGMQATIFPRRHDAQN